MSAWQYLLLGLGTSLHCVAMCGSFVLTYSVESGDAHRGWRRIVPHAAYHSAKIASYAAVALVLGGLASAARGAFDLDAARVWVMILAGTYMVALGLGMTPWFPWLRKLSPRAPEWLVRAISRTRRRAVSETAEGHASLASPIAFGLLTGLMPCAPLIAAQAGALTTGNPLSGALMMAAFGLGTAPLMIAFGYLSAYLSGRMRERLGYVAALAVVLFGLVILNRGLMLSGSPLTAESAVRALVGGPVAKPARAKLVDGRAQVRLVIQDTRFVPETLRIPAELPVRILVDRREDDACSAQLAIPELGVLADLKPFAVTAVDVPAAKAGRYTLTCGMGMMSGGVEAGDGASAGTAGARVAALVVAGVAAGGLAVWLGARRRRASRARGRAGASARTSARLPLGLTAAEAALAAIALLAAIAAGLVLGGVRP